MGRRIGWRIALALIAAGILAIEGSNAATLTVEQDDSGDFMSVWDALTAAKDGDEVVVGPGWFAEETGTGETRHAYLGEKGVVLRGAGSGSGGTEITGLEIVIEAPLEVSDILFRQCARVLRVYEPAPAGDETLTVRDCVFEENTGDLGGVVYGVDPFPATFERCAFLGNTAELGSGAIFYSRDLTLRDCQFIGNSGPEVGTVSAEEFDVENCLFWRNESVGNGSIAAIAGAGSLRNCTFWANEGFASVAIGGGEVRNCIVGKTVGGYGIACGYLDVVCSWLAANDMGNYGDCTPYDTTFDQNPKFCDPENGDFHLDIDSPCLPGVEGNNGCGLIGAYDVGCGATPVVRKSWGEVKSLFH